MKRTMIVQPNLTLKKPKFSHQQQQQQQLQHDEYVDDHQNQIQNQNQDLKINDFDSESQFSKLDENLLYEVFKHADAKTLALASCVSKQWHLTAQDERLWELICTRHWSNSINCGTQQLRSVVLALGGFRRLHALYLSKTAATVSVFPTLSPSSSSIQARVVKGGGSKRWGKDEVNLSLSLLSIRFYEKMNSVNKKQ